MREVQIYTVPDHLMIPRFYLRPYLTEVETVANTLEGVDEILAIEESGDVLLADSRGCVSLIDGQGVIKNLEIPIQAVNVIAGASIATLFCSAKDLAKVIKVVGGDFLKGVEPQTVGTLQAWLLNSTPVARARELPNCMISFEITSSGADLFGLEGYSALVADPDASVIGVARAPYANSPLLFSGPELLLCIFQLVRKHDLPPEVSSAHLANIFAGSSLDRGLRNYSENELEAEFARMLRKVAAGWTRAAWDRVFRGSIDMPKRSLLGEIVGNLFGRAG